MRFEPRAFSGMSRVQRNPLRFEVVARAGIRSRANGERRRRCISVAAFLR